MFCFSPNCLPTLQSELLLLYMTCTFSDKSATSKVDSLVFCSHFLYVSNTFSTSGDSGYPIFSLHLCTAVRLSSFLLLVLLGLLLFLLLCLFSQFYYKKILCYNELPSYLTLGLLISQPEKLKFWSIIFLSFYITTFHEWKMTVLQSYSRKHKYGKWTVNSSL